MPEQHRGIIALFLFYSLSSFSTCFLFLGASIVCVYHLKRTVDLVLWSLDRTSVYTHSWHQNGLIVFTVLLNFTKLNYCHFLLYFMLTRSLCKMQLMISIYFFNQSHLIILYVSMSPAFYFRIIFFLDTKSISDHSQMMWPNICIVWNDPLSLSFFKFVFKFVFVYSSRLTVQFKLEFLQMKSNYINL